jgi:hypothetical protein
MGGCGAELLKAVVVIPQDHPALVFTKKIVDSERLPL